MTSTLFFDDFAAGQVYDLGRKTVDKEEIIAFAREFDPQPFHLDETVGAASMLGGLAASGWHTASMAMRLLVDGFLNRTAGQGAPGIDKLQWRQPVLAGDILSAEIEVKDTRPLRSRPNLGLVSFQLRVTNQHGLTVMVQDNPILFLRRETRP